MSAVAARLEEEFEVPFGAPGASTADVAMTASDANRLFYAEHAAAYDREEHCVAREAPREFLAALLDRAIAASGTSSPRTLDACGGTGNVSELLSRRGISTTVADVSPEMLALWEAKARDLGVDADTVECDIDEFLATDERQWDLIVFSSALHHLDDYIDVVGLAAARLAPGGVLVTLLDPTQTGGDVTARLRRFDYLLSLILHPRAFAAAAGRRSRRREGGGVNVGDIAEKHVLEGVDDDAVIACLARADVDVVEHRRYVDQRYRLTEWIMRALRLSTTFHLIARRQPGGSTATTTVSE